MLAMVSFWAAPLLALGVSRVDADQVYRWTDEKGKVHFSNVAPAGQEVESEESSPSTPATSEPESPASEAAEAPEGSSAVSAKETPGRFTDLSDDTFSARVSRERTALKKELAQAKRRIRDIEEEIKTVREERQQAVGVALQRLQGMSIPSDVESEREQSLKKEKEDKEKRIQEIRKEYGELREEAAKRYGGVPGWWLPIE